MSTNLSLESLPLEGKEGNYPHPLVIIPFSLNPLLHVGRQGVKGGIEGSPTGGGKKTKNPSPPSGQENPNLNPSQ